MMQNKACSSDLFIKGKEKERNPNKLKLVNFLNNNYKISFLEKLSLPFVTSQFLWKDLQMRCFLGKEDHWLRQMEEKIYSWFVLSFLPFLFLVVVNSIDTLSPNQTLRDLCTWIFQSHDLQLLVHRSMVPCGLHKEHSLDCQ